MTSLVAQNVFNLLKERGFVAQCINETKLQALLEKEKITAYVGYDATAPSLTAGHLIPIFAHAHLSLHGHKNIILIGGGTTLIGDPSGRTDMRPMLRKKEILTNLRSFKKQMQRIFENIGVLKNAKITNKMIFLDNSAWLTKLSHLQFLREVGPHFSVNRMLTASAYEKRLAKGLTLLEFSYMPLQAYDFLYLHRKYNCVLQMGGADQWSNILAGVEFIRKVERKAVFGLTYPLLTTKSGVKMGKTAAGALWLDPKLTPAYDFYQYFINVADPDVKHFLTLLTFLPKKEIEKLTSLGGEKLRRAKEVLAYETTKIVHGEKEAQKAKQIARSLFGKERETAPSGPSTTITKTQLGKGLLLLTLLVQTGLTNSKSAARRLILQKGAYLNEKVIENEHQKLTLEDFTRKVARLKVGRKHIHQIKLVD